MQKSHPQPFWFGSIGVTNDVETIRLYVVFRYAFVHSILTTQRYTLVVWKWQYTCIDLFRNAKISFNSHFGSIGVTNDVETIQPTCRISIRVCSLNINHSEMHFSFMEMAIQDLHRYVKISFTAILVQSV